MIKRLDDPAEYRWSSYGAAMAGDERAMEGLIYVMGLQARQASGVPSDSVKPKRSVHWRAIGCGFTTKGESDPAMT